MKIHQAAVLASTPSQAPQAQKQWTICHMESDPAHVDTKSYYITVTLEKCQDQIVCCKLALITLPISQAVYVN